MAWIPHIISRLLARDKPEMPAKAIHRLNGPDTSLFVAAFDRFLVQTPDEKSENTIVF
jgi:hypothetical protein